MAETTLRELLARNDEYTDSLESGHFSGVEHRQRPAAVSICCSDSRVPQAGMWNVDEPGWLFTPSTIGNQVWDLHDGARCVDGSVLYPMLYTETDVTLVVGHTGCGAIAAALEAAQSGSSKAPPGVRKWIELLGSIVEDGLADDRVSPDREVGLVDQLVEYNVDEQVAFLLDSEEMPDEESVFGFVFDFQGTYGAVRGRTYLVNADGVTDLDALARLATSTFAEHVERLL